MNHDTAHWIRIWLTILAVLALLVVVLGATAVAASAHPSPRCDAQHPLECHKLIVENHRLRKALAWQKHARVRRQVDYSKPHIDRSFQLARLVVGIGGEWAVKLTRRIQGCESTGQRGLINPYAQNQHSTAKGAAQYLDSTWAGTTAAHLGFSVYDHEAVTLMMVTRFLHGAPTSPWVSSQGCWIA